jgi:recombinational DNA repair protein (RecF pathway)
MFAMTAPALCPWCATPLSSPDAQSCAHCGAQLVPVDPDLDLPGLTRLSDETLAAKLKVDEHLARIAEKRAKRAGGAVPLSS